MNAAMAAVGVAVAGYLVGSVPVAGLVAYRRAGIDLRDVGDRNPGYWNAKETLGRRAAVPVFVGDVAKGAVAAAVGRLADHAAGGVWWIGYVGGFAAMVGHAWPVFARFRGGRSVLTFVGAVAVLSPVTALVCVALLGLATARRGFAWGARVGVFAFPFVQLVVDGPYRTAATGCLMTLIGLRFATAARTSGRATADGA
ncbi:MAG: glycerol-3-phosphate acyltransferase [Acidimicrobiales bacterium]